MPATPSWPPKSAPRLFVDSALSQGQALAIDGQQGHYLAKVMRVSPGDAVIGVLRVEAIGCSCTSIEALRAGPILLCIVEKIDVRGGQKACAALESEGAVLMTYGNLASAEAIVGFIERIGALEGEGIEPVKFTESVDTEARC